MAILISERTKQGANKVGGTGGGRKGQKLRQRKKQNYGSAGTGASAGTSIFGTGSGVGTLGKYQTMGDGAFGKDRMRLGSVLIETKPSTRAWPRLVQLMPALVWAPMRRIAVWIGFVTLWSFFMKIGKDHRGTAAAEIFQRFPALLIAIAVTRLVARTVLPMIGILSKWLIVGKHNEGRFSLWGSEYLRWWTSRQILQICGRGIFAWSPAMISTYYRLLGAKIGKNVKISDHAHLGEADLIEIGDNVHPRF